MTLWKKIKTGKAIGLAALLGVGFGLNSANAQFGYRFPIGKSGMTLEFSGVIHEDRDPDSSATVGVPIRNNGRTVGYTETVIQSPRRDDENGQGNNTNSDNTDNSNNPPSEEVVSSPPGIYHFICNEFNDKNGNVYADSGEIKGLKNNFEVGEPVEIDFQCIGRKGNSVYFRFFYSGTANYEDTKKIISDCSLIKYRYDGADKLGKGNHAYEFVEKDEQGKVIQSGCGRITVKDKPEKKSE